MNITSVADIYSANEAARERFASLASSVSVDEAAALPDGEKWTIAEIVEHVVMVNAAMSQICTRLMGKAQSDGSPAGILDLSSFAAKTAGIADQKLEAPDFVRPTGGKAINESLERINGNNETFDNIKPLFEKFDGDTNKFPHPYFGDLSAVEWLVLAGRHEARHTAQIERVLEKIRV